MSSGARHPLVDRYLRRLEIELRELAPPQREETIAELRARIGERLADVAVTDADVREVIQSLGSPDEVASAAHRRYGIVPTTGGGFETAAVVLLLIGGLVLPLVGWVAGVVMLWVSRVWTTRDKLIGTLVVPGGLALPIFSAALVVSIGGRACTTMQGPGGTIVERCDPTTGGTAIGAVILVLLVAAPIWTTIYLTKRARRA